MKKSIGFRIFIIIALSCAIFLAASAYLAVRAHQASTSRFPTLGTETVALAGHILTLEIASTPSAQELGLGGRAALAPDAGMIFPYANPGRPGFWMKGMRFALDFVYLRGGRVVELKENVLPTPLPTPFFPSEDIDAVIEVNAGLVKAHGIKVGDEVSLPI
jgi:uncharacterized protein